MSTMDLQRIEHKIFNFNPIEHSNGKERKLFQLENTATQRDKVSKIRITHCIRNNSNDLFFILLYYYPCILNLSEVDRD